MVISREYFNTYINKLYSIQRKDSTNGRKREC